MRIFTEIPNHEFFLCVYRHRKPLRPALSPRLYSVRSMLTVSAFCRSTAHVVVAHRFHAPRTGFLCRPVCLKAAAGFQTPAAALCGSIRCIGGVRRSYRRASPIPFTNGPQCAPPLNALVLVVFCVMLLVFCKRPPSRALVLSVSSFGVPRCCDLKRFAVSGATSWQWFLATRIGARASTMRR